MNDAVVSKVPLAQNQANSLHETVLQGATGDPSEIVLCLDKGRGELYVNAVEILVNTSGSLITNRTS